MTLLDFCSRKSLVRLFFLFVMGFGLFCLNAGPQAKADFENNVAISVEAGRLTTQIRAESNANAYSVSASIAQFVAGQNHSCLLTSAGGVQCWGRNDSGQLGIGNTTHQSKPTDVVGLSSGIISLAAGDDHTCALTQLGGMNCWGQNDLGQIGDGTLINRMTPTDVTGLSTSVSQIIGEFVIHVHC